MTDKELELTHLAAKAVGIKLDSGMTRISGTMRTWRPLEDIVDRYRLAQKLGFAVDFELHTVGVTIAGEPYLFQWGGKLDEAHAFVLAAAEIGRAAT
jgi:hypothetical protein